MSYPDILRNESFAHKLSNCVYQINYKPLRAGHLQSVDLRSLHLYASLLYLQCLPGVVTEDTYLPKRHRNAAHPMQSRVDRHRMQTSGAFSK